MGRKPVILVGGNMGRNDGVDYCAKLAADFPEVIFVSYEGQPDVLAQHIEEADAVIGSIPERLLPRARRVRWVQTTGAGQTRSARQPSSRAKTSWRRRVGRACGERARANAGNDAGVRALPAGTNPQPARAAPVVLADRDVRD